MLAAGLVLYMVSVSALVSYSPVKTWPKSWPPEFNGYLDRALHISPMTGGPAEEFYDIHFNDYRQFESLWPAVLKVKTDGAPLTLKTFKPIEGSPLVSDFYTKPYLRILVPPSNPARKIEVVRLPSGEPVEYLQLDTDGWRPLGSGPRETGYAARARTEIVLYVDGSVIDLNRIPLPRNTPIVDEREVVNAPGT